MKKGLESNPLLMVHQGKASAKEVNKRKSSRPVDKMKMRAYVMSHLVFLCAVPGWSSTTVFLFGGPSKAYACPWNLNSGTKGTVPTPAGIPARLRDASDPISAITVGYNGGGLTDAGNIAVSSLQPNGSYKVSSISTVSGLANVPIGNGGSPVIVSGNSLSIGKIYLSSGTSMPTWQVVAGSSTPGATMDFTDSLLSPRGNDTVSSPAVMEGISNLAVPEFGTVSLCLVGLTALLMHRRVHR
ncbi:hypothetical protein [uncultured Akkermansia sp.]|uniref:hypothetical protein n=1 Tax=uncultured Akkermansia sp. TaxID=512294 RepID=UPI00265CA186|nr:hypothetical protein [uncultured Akkermansia sp.]